MPERGFRSGTIYSNIFLCQLILSSNSNYSLLFTTRRTRSIDFQINNFTPFIPLSLVGEGQGEGKCQENVKLFIWKSIDFTIFLFLRDLRVRGIPFLLIRKNYSIIRIAESCLIYQGGGTSLAKRFEMSKPGVVYKDLYQSIHSEARSSEIIVTETVFSSTLEIKAL